MTLRIAEKDGACTFRGRVAPRGQRDEVIGKHGDAIKIRVKAPPTQGKANEAPREFLAEQLNVSKWAVEILFGHTSRWKRVRVESVSPDAIRALLKTT
jgi:hypothetical protein